MMLLNQWKQLRFFLINNLFDLSTKQQSMIKSLLKERIILIGIITIFFIAGLIVNSLTFQSVFNYSAQVVTGWQSNPALNNEFVLGFMGFISNYLFYPNHYEYYMMAFLILSYRKLQVSVFIIWLSFLYFVCETLQDTYHYPRPYMTNDGVQMLSKDCLYDYGMPSEHTALGIVFLEFFVRFYLRQYKIFWKTSYIWYIIAVLLQLLICFSRMILGMHSLNQVLFGFVLGIFLCILYVNFFETLLMKACLAVMQAERKMISAVIITTSYLVLIIVECIICFVPQYHNQEYVINLNNVHGCAPVKTYNSFQYGDFKGTGNAAGIYGVLYALLLIKNPQPLILKPLYPYLSFKNLKRIVLGLLIGGIPMWAFRTNLWKNVQHFDNVGLPILKYSLFTLGSFLGPFCYLWITPMIGECLQLQIYRYPQYYDQYKQDEIFSMETQKFEQFKHQLELPDFSRKPDHKNKQNLQEKFKYSDS